MALFKGIAAYGAVKRFPAGRRWLSRMVVVIGFLLLPAAPCMGGEYHNALTLQGFTGLLNTPNAEVTEEGKAYLLYSNQKESQWRNAVPREESYLFSVGLFSFMEIGGRLTEAPGRARDLSGNFKVKLPFIPKKYFLPGIAFGMQDVGGGLKKLQTKYAVATEKLGRFRLSLGYGAGPDRMDGVFGGVELKAFDWLYLIAEHDTKEKNAGIRLVTPSLFGLPININLTAKTSLDYRTGHMEYGIGLQFPLGFDDRSRKPPGEAREIEATAGSDPNADQEETEDARQPDQAHFGGAAFGLADDDVGMRELHEKLVAGGFQNVRVGADSEKTLLVVEYENVRYSYNELDGLGVVAGMVVDTVSPDFEMIQFVIKKKGIRVLQVSAPLSDFGAFLHDPQKRSQLAANLDITAAVEIDKAIRFINGDANPSWLQSELVVYPGFKTYVGTEVGVFDYVLSIKPDYYLNLWKGAVLNARWDIPVTWSENFEDAHMFRNARRPGQLERIMLFQTFKPTPDVMVNLGAGLVLPSDNYGTINEIMWTPGNGNHRFTLKQVYLASNDKNAAYPGNKAYMASYRYYFGPLDLYLIGTGGQFLDQDRGFTLELKRFFGDTAFSIYYKNSRVDETSAARSENVQVGGVQISIPLTTRRAMKPFASVQVKGANEWSYSQETKIVTPGGQNTVNTSIGLDPQPAYNLQHIYYNRDRLSEDYIREHLLRLREAYQIYRSK